MCKFLKEEEVRILNSREELQEALDFYEENDKWIKVKASDVKVFGVTDYPLFLTEIKEKVDTCSDEVFDTCVKDAGIFVTIPHDNAYKTYATRYTSLLSIYDRSGSNCRMVRNIKDTKAQKALSAEKRGELINLGYSISLEDVLFYISDEMVSYNGSKLYVILPYKDGVKAIENMSESFGDLKYSTGFISHENLVAQWWIDNADTKAHALSLQKAGIVANADTVKYVLSFSSSNIGNAKMSARVMCYIHGNLIPIGKPVSVWHLSKKAVDDVSKLNEANGASIEHFRSKLYWLGASLKDNEEQIEILGNTDLKYPDDCFKRILKFCPTLPKRIKDEALEACSFPPCTTAMDLYLQVAALISNIGKNLNNFIQITEEIAQLQYLDFKKFDKPNA